MIDYNAFHNYLVESVAQYQRTHSTRGIWKLARDYHCTAITQEQFKDFGLINMKANEVTEEFSRWVRDKIGRSEAKATLRENIGALDEGILANSRISQGSDSTVQITITQPVQPEASAPQPQSVRQPDQPKKPAYRVGQVAYHRGTVGWGLFLIDRVDYDSLGYHYTLVVDQHGKEILSVWPEGDIGRSEALCEKSLRPAKGKEIARFLCALTREGYLWEADNVNGLFTVKGKIAQRTEQAVEVFANDLPNGYRGIYALPAYGPSPYRFALRCVCVIDNAEQFMCHTSQPPVVQNAVLRQLETINGQGCDGFSEYLEYDLPTLCCTEELREHRVAFVKVNSGGTSYWLARDRDVLRLLAWISFIV